MTNNGWVAIYRKGLFHKAFKRPAGFREEGELSEYEAWEWMIHEARYAPEEIVFDGQSCVVERGEFFTSVDKLRKTWVWKSKNRVQGFLKRLERLRMLSQKTGTDGQIISICNYVALQPDQSPNGTTLERHGYAKGTTTVRYIKREKGKKEKTISELRSDSAEGDLMPVAESGITPSDASPRRTSEKKQATTWPADFDLDGDLHRYAEDAGIDFHGIPALWERFKNHHQAKGSTFKDWRAAWRTWVGNEIKFSRERRQHGSGRPLGNGNYDTPSGRAPLVDYALSQIGKPQEPEENSFWPNKTA